MDEVKDLTAKVNAQTVQDRKSIWKLRDGVGNAENVQAELTNVHHSLTKYRLDTLRLLGEVETTVGSCDRVEKRCNLLRSEIDDLYYQNMTYKEYELIVFRQTVSNLHATLQDLTVTSGNKEVLMDELARQIANNKNSIAALKQEIREREGGV